MRQKEGRENFGSTQIHPRCSNVELFLRKAGKEQASAGLHSEGEIKRGGGENEGGGCGGRDEPDST